MDLIWHSNINKHMDRLSQCFWRRTSSDLGLNRGRYWSCDESYMVSLCKTSKACLISYKSTGYDPHPMYKFIVKGPGH